MKPDFVQVS